MRNVRSWAKAIGMLALFLSLGLSASQARGNKPPECAAIEAKASFYAGNFIGRRTANGEIFTSRDMTAAHKTLPFGTRLKVTNPDNGQTVEVVINDRGPYIKGRTLDLSLAAAEALGMVDKGVARVRIEGCQQKTPSRYQVLFAEAVQLVAAQ